MFLFVLFVGLAIVTVVVLLVAYYKHCIKHRICPICGAPIFFFTEDNKSGHKSGYKCTGCEWVQYTSQTQED